MNINLASVVERDDGSAIYYFDLSREAILAFTKLGLQTALIRAAEQARLEHGSLEEEDADQRDDEGGEREEVQAT